MRPSVTAAAALGVFLAATHGVRASAAPPGSDAPSLWITQEQRAQQLLDAGHTAEAAQLFSDPRRRAFADAQLGHYAEAARLLSSLRDPQSEYNRGNALARSGNLVGALASYDAALQQAPRDRDIRHNRDLVAREIASRSQQRNGQGGGSQSQSNGQQNESQSNRNGREGSGAQNSPDSRGGKSAGSQSGQSSTGGNSPQQESEQAREDAEVAADLKRRDRNGEQNPGSQSQRSSGSRGSARGSEAGGASRGGGAVTDDLNFPPPKSEQALALEQWLRRIPEDPGGLLRRKFLIEHMERQEGSEQ